MRDDSDEELEGVINSPITNSNEGLEEVINNPITNSNEGLEEVINNPITNSNEGLEEVAISVDTIKSLVDLIEGGGNRGKKPQPTIFMVPKIYRDQNPSCFDPQVVSIGPLHRGHINVQENEWLKGTYMHDLLARLDSPPQETLRRCLAKVNSSINKIKLCYGGVNNYHDLDVAKMMVTDACFILEFIQKLLKRNRLILLGNMFTSRSIFRDLLLIENQIPFFVLQDIFNLTLKKIQPNNSLINLILDHLLCEFNPFKAELKLVNNGTNAYDFKHILEILHKSCRPDDLLPKHGSLERVSHSAVELDRAGVKFKPNQGRNMEIAMEYESIGWTRIFGSLRKPTLRMPVLTIGDNTELLLRNLIAYEQSYPNIYGHYFTSLAFALDMLVDSAEDVNKLVESKVIVNYLGSNESAAYMINNICNEVACITFMYEQTFQQLDDHYKSYWPKNMAWLRRTYFNSPWNAICSSCRNPPVCTYCHSNHLYSYVRLIHG